MENPLYNGAGRVNDPEIAKAMAQTEKPFREKRIFGLFKSKKSIEEGKENAERVGAELHADLQVANEKIKKEKEVFFAKLKEIKVSNDGGVYKIEFNIGDKKFRFAAYPPVNNESWSFHQYCYIDDETANASACFEKFPFLGDILLEEAVKTRARLHSEALKDRKERDMQNQKKEEEMISKTQELIDEALAKN